MATSVFDISILFIFIFIITQHCLARHYSDNEIRSYRNRVTKMFQHAYDGYIFNAYPYDELRPLTCDGVDTWGSFSLTLVDALDTLAVMGNYSEFRRVAHLIIENMNFDSDINVSVFETNIRILGGLLSAHLVSRRAGMLLEPGWPCSGPLLRLAENVANRLLPAFNTTTGMPYGTVNLQKGLPVGETNVTCTACVGSFIIEFGTLSRLTGDVRYEKIAMKALHSLWKFRSNLDLVGNHIDVQQGVWVATEAGIGAGIDSYFEYLVKGSILFQKPELMEMFKVYKRAIEKYVKQDDWYLWVSMTKGQVTFPVFQSLEAYWPGLLSLIGEVDSAMKTLHNYHQVWRQFGFTPEFYNIPQNQVHTKREGYPLRPELIESVMYLYQATKDPFLLDVGVDILESIEANAKTSCGYATVKDVRDHTLENRMESFFLAETTKYLYLLFDSNNFLHKTGSEGDVISTPNGNCVIESGGYIFNTEAHPIDAAAVYCCSADKREADLWMQNFHDKVDLLALLDLSEHTVWNEFKMDTKINTDSELNQDEILETNGESKEVEDDGDRGNFDYNELTKSVNQVYPGDDNAKIKKEVLIENLNSKNEESSTPHFHDDNVQYSSDKNLDITQDYKMEDHNKLAVTASENEGSDFKENLSDSKLKLKNIEVKSSSTDDRIVNGNTLYSLSDIQKNPEVKLAETNKNEKSIDNKIKVQKEVGINIEKFDSKDIINDGIQKEIISHEHANKLNYQQKGILSIEIKNPLVDSHEYKENEETGVKVNDVTNKQNDNLLSLSKKEFDSSFSNDGDSNVDIGPAKSDVLTVTETEDNLIKETFTHFISGNINILKVEVKTLTDSKISDDFLDPKIEINIDKANNKKTGYLKTSHVVTKIDATIESKSKLNSEKTEVVTIGSLQPMTPETIKAQTNGKKELKEDVNNNNHKQSDSKEDKLVKTIQRNEEKPIRLQRWSVLNFTNSYEILLCPIQPFISRLSLMGEMFFHD